MKFKLLEDRVHRLEGIVEELTNKVKLLEPKSVEAAVTVEGEYHALHNVEEEKAHKGPGRPPKAKEGK